VDVDLQKKVHEKVGLLRELVAAKESSAYIRTQFTASVIIRNKKYLEVCHAVHVVAPIKL